jgi:hypothetical protein
MGPNSENLCKKVFVYVLGASFTFATPNLLSGPPPSLRTQFGQGPSFGSPLKAAR